MNSYRVDHLTTDSQGRQHKIHNNLTTKAVGGHMSVVCYKCYCTRSKFTNLILFDLSTAPT